MEKLTLEEFYTRFVFDKDSDLIHTGSFSKVFLGIDKVEDQKVAIKILHKEGKYRHYPALKRWAKIGRYEHSSLINYLGFYKIQPSGAPEEKPGFEAVVMEPVSGGDLKALLQQPPDLNEVHKIAEGIINGLEVLHERGIPHGNLKPGNILIQNIGHLHVRLADYGFFHQDSFNKARGKFKPESLKYISPEQIEPKNFGKRGRVRYNTDFWSLGVILYELIQGKYPFPAPGETRSDLLTAIMRAELPPDLPKIRGGMGQLIRACLERDASIRPQKVDDLRKLLTGELIWSPTGIKQPSEPPAIKAPPVLCRNCQRKNPPGSLICSECRKALFGPHFLRGFKYPHRFGFWTIVFFTMTFLALNFFYFSFHDKFRNDGYDQIIEMTQKEGIEVPEIVELVITGAIIGVFGLLTLVLFWFWYYRVSVNMRSLGSRGQRFIPLVFVSIVLAVIAFIALSFPKPSSNGFEEMNRLNIMAMIVTFVLLVPPLFALQELWKGSNPSQRVEGYIWRRSASSFLIFSWWLCSLLLPVLIILPVLPNTFEGKLSEIWFFITVGITIGYWAMGVVFILRVNYRQSKKYLGWSRDWARKR